MNCHFPSGGGDLIGIGVDRIELLVYCIKGSLVTSIIF